MRTTAAALALAAALSLALAAFAAAAGGDLDNSFSNDGKKVVNFGFNQNARGLAVDGDGRTLLAGGADNGTQFSSSFGVVRLTAAGDLDKSFSGDGKRLIGFPGKDYASATDVGVDSRGRIVVAGYARSGTDTDFAVARLFPDGSLDKSFSGDGKQTVSFSIGSASVSALVIDGRNRIVLAGTALQAAAFARLGPGGALDKSFSGDGRRTLSFGSNANVATDVAIDGAGRIVASALAHGNGFGVIRLLPGGANDTSFSGDGKVETDFGLSCSANGIALQPGGRVVAAGYAYPSGMAVARYHSDGSPDGSFSDDGKRTVAMGGSSGANDVVLHPNGRIVLVGVVYSGVQQSFAIARLRIGGSLDPSFSGDGKRAISFPNWPNASAAEVELRGELLTVAGLVDNGLGEGNKQTRYAATRLTG